MTIWFIIIGLALILLVVFMFFILKNAVKTINVQAKSYFVDKLQEYDDLINEKETKLNEINELIKDKESGIEEAKGLEKGSNYTLDYNVIDLMSEAKYQEENIFNINRKINEEFNIDYEELIKDFMALVDSDKQYDFCLNLRNKFDSEMVYSLKLLLEEDFEKALRDMLDEDEFKVYEIYRRIMMENNVEGFINYLDELVQLNNPIIKILVGNKHENYNYLGENIETIVSEDIYKGIKIIYKNKLYDYSLSERNG